MLTSNEYQQPLTEIDKSLNLEISAERFLWSLESHMVGFHQMPLHCWMTQNSYDNSETGFSS